MKSFKQIEIGSDTTLAGVKIAKEAVKAIKKSVNDGNSALECMELETESTYQVSTYRDGVVTTHACNLTRITPLSIKVNVQYTTPHLEVSWIAEGELNNKCCIAKIITYATWKDGWYSWDVCEDNGTPKAPYAQIYTQTR